MKLRSISFFLLSLTLFSSCEKDIEYNGKYSTPMLVVNAAANAGSSSEISVSRSRFFLDASSQSTLLADANVYVSINGSRIKARYDDTLYSYCDDRMFNEGDTVTIDIQHDRYGKATASCCIPKASALKLTKDNVSYDNEQGDSIRNVSIAIEKPAGDKGGIHYYRLKFNSYCLIVNHLDWENPDSIEYFAVWLDTFINKNTSMKLGLKSGLELVEDLADNADRLYCDNELYFTDELLASDDILEFQTELLRDYWFVQYDDKGRRTDERIGYFCNFSLETLTEDTYRYYKSVQAYDDSDWSLFQEPVTIYGNINGGLGALCSSSASELVVIHDCFQSSWPMP